MKNDQKTSLSGELPGVMRPTKKPPRVVLYGPPGVGKSTFGANAPDPVFITTEDGVDNLPVDQFKRADLWGEVLGNAILVAAGGHKYQTVIVDTLNGAVDLAADHVCESQYGGQRVAQKGNGGFMAWGQGWKSTAVEIRPLLAALDDCRAGGMTVILLAHMGLQNVKHPTDGDYQKFAPDIDKNVWSKISSWADIVLRADYDYTIQKNRGDLKGRAIGSGRVRKAFSVGSAAEDAKCRVGYELPDSFLLAWSEFEKHVGTKSATLEELKSLWHLMDEKQVAKTHEYFGTSDIEQAPLHNVRVIINRLRQVQSDLAQVDREGEKTNGES